MERFANAQSVSQVVGELIGACSVTRFWDEMPKDYPRDAGVFRDGSATALMADAMARIEQLTVPTITRAADGKVEANWDGDAGPVLIARELFEQIAMRIGAVTLVEHLIRQINFSLHTFGPGRRFEAILDHMEKEKAELRAAREAGKDALPEWVDLILLALDGAWRDGHSPEQVAEAITAKLAENEQREWPDWRTAEPNEAIEHVRGRD